MTVLTKLTLRIPQKSRTKLKREALKNKLTLSEFLREKLTALEEIEQPTASETETKNQNSKKDAIHLESLFLLREIAIEINSQILRRTQIQLDQTLGEDRPKIGI